MDLCVATDTSTQFSVTGSIRCSGSDINVVNAKGVTINSIVKPRPQITKLELNPLSLDVTVEFSIKQIMEDIIGIIIENKNTTDGELVVGVQMLAFADNVTLNQSDFTEAGIFVMTAFMIKDNHQPIPKSNIRTASFEITTANNASLVVTPTDITEVLDIDNNQTTHTIQITDKNNLTNIRYSQSTFNNWVFVTPPTETGFKIKLNDDVKLSDLSTDTLTYEETVTIAIDVGDKDTSGDATKSQKITLNAKLVDSAEFSVTGSIFNIIDVRTYGTSATEYGLHLH